MFRAEGQSGLLRCSGLRVSDVEMFVHVHVCIDGCYVEFKYSRRLGKNLMRSRGLTWTDVD